MSVKRPSPKRTLPSSDAELARLHDALAGRSVVEKRMMGALVLMVDGHMCCGLTRGALMVRIGPAGQEAALAQPHVRPLDIGGRSPRGFVVVDPPGFETDADLRRWVGAALAFVATLPPKTSKPAASRAR